MRALVAAVVAAAAVLLAPAAPAHAEVSAACWAHLAELPPGETPAGDVRYHRMRGEFSPCTEQEAAEADSARSDRDNDRRDEKSRYCKKRWFC